MKIKKTAPAAQSAWEDAVQPVNRIPLAYALVDALQNCPTEMSMPIVDDFLLAHLSDGPPVAFLSIESDARWWAETCSTSEARAYTGHLLKRMASTSMGRHAKKLHLVDIWRATSEPDRIAFLKHVRPNGNFAKKVPS